MVEAVPKQLARVAQSSAILLQCHTANGTKATVELLRKAAQAGVVEAQHRLASVLLPLVDSQNEAIGWLRCAAHQQHAGAQQQLLEWLRSNERHDEYVQQLQAFAKMGDAAMQYRYARLLSGSDAQGVCVCVKQCYFLFLLRVFPSVPNADAELRVPKDEMAALGWFRLAARQGHARSQFEVGSRLWQGVGVPPSGGLRKPFGCLRHTALHHVALSQQLRQAKHGIRFRHVGNVSAKTGDNRRIVCVSHLLQAAVDQELFNGNIHTGIVG